MFAPRSLAIALVFTLAPISVTGCDGDRSATDGGARPDAHAPVCATLPSAPSPYPGCNPEIGIECDGDYRETDAGPEGAFCKPECPADQCCSPQHGQFTCVDRDEAGNCPAADLFIDADRVAESFVIEYRSFAADDCAIVEGCVGGPGTRRLLRFDTWTPNVGTADAFLGDPHDYSGYFEHSDCHDHYHFDLYADYELLSDDGSCLVAKGHKQAFCLMDYYQYPGTDRTGAVYNCTYQGIQPGWQDVYRQHLDCQWIDVTDVPPGEYRLRVRINGDHVLYETNYANNDILVPVTITDEVGAPAIDLSASCPEGTPDGLARACGFTRSYEGQCAPGETVTVGCSATCGLGSCTGDTIIRVCETAAGVNCDSSTELTSNDDSGCGSGECLTGGDCCSLAQFSCPPTGTYSVWTAAYEVGGTASCTVAPM